MLKQNQSDKVMKREQITLEEAARLEREAERASQYVREQLENSKERSFINLIERALIVSWLPWLLLGFVIADDFRIFVYICLITSSVMVLILNSPFAAVIFTTSIVLGVVSKRAFIKLRTPKVG